MYYKSIQLTFFLLSIIQISFAQTKQKPFQELDVFELEYAADPNISPDGSQVAYIRYSMDIMNDRKVGQLWTVNTNGENHQKLLANDQSSYSPRWSPSGDRIAYITSSKQGSEIHMCWVNSGKTARISSLDRSPSGLSWSPDGSQLAFSMLVAQSNPVLVRAPKKPKGAKWASKPRVTTRVKHEADGRGYIEPGFSQYFIIPAEGGTARQVSHGDFMHRGTPQWTNDGKGLVFSSNRNENWEYDFMNSEIYHLDIKEQSYSVLTSRKGPDYNPVISPNGNRIAYLGYSDKVQTYQINELNLMNLDGSNKQQIKLKLDRKIQNLSWAADGKALFCTYDNHGDSKIAKIDLKGKVKVVAENLGGTAFGRPYGGGSYTLSDSDAIVYTTTSTEHPAEVKLVAENSARMLTDLNADLLPFRNLASIEDIWYESTVDGEKIQGWIAYPPNYDATKEYPLIVENHGGPISNYGFRFSPEIQLYAAAGYVVFYPNPRGSTGYGEKFGNLLYHNYPGDDYQDVMDGVDVLIQKGVAHEDKLYVTGGSAGGIMTAWMIGKNNRFEAAVVAKPVINWISKTLVADNYYGYAYYRYPGQPWENPMEYWKFSPISLVENVKTPTMVMVGMNDLRTPPSESKQYYHALKLLKVETALVEIPGASHGITGRPSQLITKVAHVLAWFENYK